MACLINVLAVVILILLGGVMGQQGAHVQANDNAEQFALLCRIYNVAKNPPINHVDIQDPLQIVNDIDSINASFDNEKWLNETEHTGNSEDAQLKHTTTRETTVTQAILRRITKKAHTILEQIGRVNATRDIEKVKTEFSQIIFGKGRSESHLCDESLKDLGDRATACGRPGAETKGSHAGKNLVVDFFCICAQRTKSNEGIDNACRVQVGGKGDQHGWGDQGPLGAVSMWASLKRECGNLMQQHTKSTEEGHELLEDFLSHLKAGGLYRWGKDSKDSSRKASMLGTAAGTDNDGNGKDILCNGRKGKNGGGNVKSGGICVYYGPVTQLDDNIEWLKKFKTALASVDAVNNQTAFIQRSLQKLQMLQHRAEYIYETANVISETQKPFVPKDSQTAAKRLTAYNAAWRYRHHLILPWVLLL
ncbi:Variant surface glycoprotein [Trypanosoma congolense IL3000]|uniref:Variant surface glycoprotein n=1 Tax=Trypanosoma congolense (strain IL3000) TaxID=1068625 RepID=F9WB28_TRYCI|nr:Variant surface glycoprotein [Trypanosoma congolense IL3000]